MGKKDRMIRGSPRDWEYSSPSAAIQMKRNPKFTADSLGIRLVHDEPSIQATIGGEWNWENDFMDYPRPEDIYKRHPTIKRTSLGFRLAHNIND